MFVPQVTVIGGGLAGCEAAFQLAERGICVSLVEMKPARLSPAHTTPLLAELVCSNSLRSDDPSSPAGLLKAELRAANSLIIACADAAAVPAGDALAVDRHQFSRLVTSRIVQHPRIRLERRLVDELPDGPCILAGGPLVDGGAARIVRKVCGDRLYFYDAIAPIVDAETLDWEHCFRADRVSRKKAQLARVREGGRRRGRGRHRGSSGDRMILARMPEAAPAPPEPTPAEGGAEHEGDYINCPLSKDEYFAFVTELLGGRKVTPHHFEDPRYFEGCLPIEVMAERGPDTLAFGPMKPLGLIDPAGPLRAQPPYAIVQLRAENRYGTAYNLVGFQTRLAYPEQKRIFSMIPALRSAEFLRYGSIHRNSYVEAHRVLDETLALRELPDLHLAGQITGVEGYIESTAMGLLCGLFLHSKITGSDPALRKPPATTALGALYYHVTRPRKSLEPYVPMNINFGLLPPIAEAVGELRAKHAGKTGRRVLHAERARAALPDWLARTAING